MNERYNKASLKMPNLLKELLKQSPISRDNLGVTKIPQSGVYVFFENDKPIYVGRSNRMKERLKEHSSVSSDHYSASLAFRIAKQEYLATNIKEKKLKNKELMENSSFINKFNTAKGRISKTKIRFIQIEDQIEQALFEIYAHLELKTEYNDFKTH